MVVGLITDQWPSGYDKYWTTFLGQETAFLNGAERIAKMMNFPVFYCELSKNRRGYCEAEFKLMTETPKETREGEITEMFAHRLEQTIRKEPAYWLWSHKRWKMTREEADRLEEKERVGFNFCPQVADVDHDRAVGSIVVRLAPHGLIDKDYLVVAVEPVGSRW